jgi:acetyl-CoA C-acetyltransferase
MTIDPRTPVIVGAGQVLAREACGDRDGEPAALIVRALRLAGEDSGTGERLLRRADSVRCVPAIGWRYRDLAALVAGDLGAHPRETAQSAFVGGEGPLLLLGHTARAIAAGELDVALLGGGEAVVSVRAAERDGVAPSWRAQDEGVAPARTLGTERAGVNELEGTVGLAPPVVMYALIESAVRAQHGASAEEHLRLIAGLWSRFSQVAAENPHAWIERAYTPEQIATASAENRLVAAPYTKLLTANIQVNMASGLILTSARAAQRAGVPKERWVFVHSGAQAQEEWHVSERPQLAASPAIRAAGRAALDHAGLTIDEIAHIDLYSCFPCAVQIAALELGLALDDAARPLTVTGGLTFAGGPGNNYGSHAIATLARRLRKDHEAFGLATAVGWYMTKHALAVCSARPPRRPFASLQPRLPPTQARRVRGEHDGPATVEAYTVTYGRDGAPEAAILSMLGADGGRALLRSEEPAAVAAVLSDDPIGRALPLGSPA